MVYNSIMTSNFTKIFQILATIVQIGNVVGSFTPAKWQPVVTGVVSVLQTVQGTVAHYYNPDGTQAEVK